jgi:hypothetical protein
MPDRLLTISPLASRSFHDLTGQAIASKANSQSPALGHRLDRTISGGIWEKAPTPNKGRCQHPLPRPLPSIGIRCFANPLRHGVFARFCCAYLSWAVGSKPIKPTGDRGLLGPVMIGCQTSAALRRDRGSWPATMRASRHSGLTTVAHSGHQDTASAPVPLAADRGEQIHSLPPGHPESDTFSRC